jgi:tape measure domain-containing protein
MATQNINIVITSTGAVTVVRDLRSIGTAALQAINPLRQLQTQINAVMGALALKQITDWADEWISAANKDAVFSKNQQETNAILDRLFTIAQRVGQPLNGVVDLYHKLSIQAKALGASIEDNVRVTEIVSKTLTIQGTSAATARGTLLQLSQAFGTGVIKAQEYNSLLTGAPLLLKKVSENIEAAGGSVAKLTALQRAGKLQSKEFYDAIIKSGEDVDKLFGTMTRTFGQSFEVAINGISKWLGQLVQSLGLSDKFFKFTTYVVENLDTIAKMLVIVGVGIATAFAPAILTAFGTGLSVIVGLLGRITVLLLANPFVLIATAVAAVIAFGDSWNAGLDKMTTVKDYFRALVSFIVDGLFFVQATIEEVWDGFVSIVSSVFGTSTDVIDGAVAEWMSSIIDFYSDVGTGFIGVVKAVAKTMDAIAGLIIGVVIGIGRIFGGLPAVVGNVFAQVYNNIVEWMEKAVNVVIAGINKIREFTGGTLIDAVSFERKAVDQKAFQNYGESIAESINDGFAIQGNYMQERVDALTKRAQAFGAERARLAAAAKNTTDLAERGTPESITGKPKKGKADNSLQKLENDLRSLLNKIDPAAGALLEMAKAQETLNKAVERGLITETQRQTYLVALEQHYKDILDPLGKYTRQIQENIELSQLDARTRERESELLRIKQDMLSKSKPLTDEQIASTRELLILQQQMNEAMAARDSLQGGSASEGLRTFTTQIQEMQKLLADPSSGFKKTDATAALQNSLGAGMFEGTQEAMDLQVAQWNDMYTRIAELRMADVISAQTASQMVAKVQVQQLQQQNLAYTNFFSSLEGLAQSSNAKIAAIGKAAAITNATIKGYEAVQVALASAPPPYNYALAAGVAAQAAANVAKIISTGTAFATGGDFTVGGTGGVDSQMVAFRASPGEQVSVSTPTQVRHGTATKVGGEEPQAQPMVVRVINQLDPQMFQEFLNTPEGQQAIVNSIRYNSDEVRQAMDNG